MKVTQVLDKLEVPQKLRLELIRKVEGERLPIIIKAKNIKRTDEIIFFPRMKPMPRAYFIKSVLRREYQKNRFLGGTKTVVDYFARCNAYWSESLEKLDEVEPKYSQELENLLLSDDMTQHIEGVAGFQKFILDETVLKLMLVVFAISIPFGFLMDSILNLVPHQIVNWLP